LLGQFQWLYEHPEALQISFATADGLGWGSVLEQCKRICIGSLFGLGERSLALQISFVTAHFWIGFGEGELRQNRISCAVPQRGGLPKSLNRCRGWLFLFMRFCK
jgi:hypothetical protein